MKRWHAFREHPGELSARTPQSRGDSAQLLLRLQRTAGNRAVGRLVGAASPAIIQRMWDAGQTLPGPVIQRTVEDAANALRAAGCVQMKEKEFGKWLKEKPGKGPQAPKNSDLYGVTQEDLDAVNALLRDMRAHGAGDKKINEARAKLKSAQDALSGVEIIYHNVIVNLDSDQQKHQPAGYQIGTRQTHGGTKWSPELRPDATWHQATTLPIIGEWAANLEMKDGDVVSTKQSVPLRDGNHYEGFCVQVDGKRYVFFHCYPSK